MSITLNIGDKTTRERIKRNYPCCDLTETKIKVNLEKQDLNKLMSELKDILP